MYKNHVNFITPQNENVKIWRYLDFTKYVSILEKHALFFTRSDKFEDKLEGITPKKEIDYLIERQKFEEGSLITKEKFKKLLTENDEFEKTNMAINCWHINDYESMAMWKIYLKSNEGLVIQSTYSKLRDSFHVHEKDDIFIGEVIYADYDEFKWKNKLFYKFMHKRKFFNYENELRAFVYRYYDFKSIGRELSTYELVHYAGFDYGDYISIDLDILIENIIVAPNSPEWFVELVREITVKYGFNKNVVRSSLDKDPYL